MNKKNLKHSINKDISYPEYNDGDFQNKIYKKREFYYHKIPEMKPFKNYKEIKEYRDSICGGKIKPYSHQSFLANFISPNTPYTGLLLFHGVGTGKTASAINIAENFKSMIKKYNTKIHVLVPGPLLKENWKDEIVKFTGASYFKDLINKLGYIDEQEEAKAKKDALKESLFYYKIMTHRSFYKKVLGEKIKDQRDDINIKKKYRITDKGEIERDISVDKIESLDNTLLIVDEIHGFTGNEHGDALKKIIEKSKNLRLILLSGTPMKNLGDDIVEIINYLRPKNDKMRRDKIFTSNKDYNLEFKPGGEEYLKKMCSGYVSYYRGANPYLFAKRNNQGEVPPQLIFTKCIRCNMEEFQKKSYYLLKDKTDDPLERSTSSIANFVLPILSKDKQSIIGTSGENGINAVISNLKTDKTLYLQKLNQLFFKNKIKNIDEIIYESKNTSNITGLILKKENIKIFSTKFSEAFNNIDDKIDGKKGTGTIFVYSNLVKVGVEIFQEILLQNGYLEFKENQDYILNNDTIDYKTGIKYKDFDTDKMKRQFMPATFIRITGKAEDDDDLPEEKKYILDNYFNNLDNVDGKYLKIILGSKVMTEGITLENTSEVHVLDVYYNLGKVEQVIGRAVRQCKHYKITSEDNQFPEVKIYKYVIKLDNNQLSSDENLYRKAELKYLLIKKVERYLKEIAIDCPINYNGNVFKNEVTEYKNCVIPNAKNVNKKQKWCPIGCDFMNCDYVCENKKLNLEYYDKNSKIYKKISKENLDYDTFIDDLAKNEISETKQKIIDLYKLKYVYTLREILNEIKKKYTGEQKELFEDIFVYKALDDLVPVTKNDYINYNDTIYDKYNIAGYLIYRGKFYIFQPYEQDEKAPMFYRKLFSKKLINKLSLLSYLDNNPNFNKVKKIDQEKKVKESKKLYDFETITEYYDTRQENDIVGVIDKFSGARKITIGEDSDIFKIRDKRTKNLDKKRGEGITSLTGAVCYSSKDKKELKEISKKIDLEFDKKASRVETCLSIRDKLFYLEKYSTGTKKITYMIIPYNHSKYLFPLNLEDRIIYVQKKFNKLQNSDIKFNSIKQNNGIFLEKRDKKLPKYEVSFSYSKTLKKNTEELLDRYKFKKNKNKWTTIFE